MIKLILWDAYGTIFSSKDDETSDDGDEGIRLRPLALECLTEIRARGIFQATISDGNLNELRRNLNRVGIPVDVFFDLYQMQINEPKDVSFIRSIHNCLPEETFVIGDNYEIDIKLSRQQGCHAIHVPEREFITPLPKEDIMRILDN